MKNMKMLLAIWFLVLAPEMSSAVNLTLKWDSSGASNYKIRMSTDNGRRWDIERETHGPGDTFIWVMAPEDKLLLFKVAANEGTQTVFNNYAGCWYDHRLKTAETFFQILKADSGCKLEWDAVDTATGYILYFSENEGSTWPTEIILGDVLEYTWSEVPVDKLVFVKGCATKEGVTGCRDWSGSWYDARRIAETAGHLYWHYPLNAIRLTRP